MGQIPTLDHGLYTYEAIMSTIHKEKALAEHNPTSIIVKEGLTNMLNAFLPRRCQDEDIDKVGPYLVIAALTARRMGGRAFCHRYLQVLATAAAEWRQTHGPSVYPLLLKPPSYSTAAVTPIPRCRHPTNKRFTDALQEDWSPESLRWVALSVANQIRIERKERAVTEAHLPHSAVPDHLSGCSAHWGDVDWLQAHLSASSIAAALCPPAFGSGSRQLGLLKNAARVGQHITGFGGTQFLLQIPLFDVVTAFESQGVARPYDWASWSPPGPGCRATLFQLRPRWQREHNGEAFEASLYSAVHTPAGREYEAELDTVHAHFMATAKVELEQLLQTFPAPRNWTRRDTQASLCAFSRYLHVRRSLLDPSVPLVKARIYANAPTWPL